MACNKSRYPDKQAAEGARNRRMASHHNRPAPKRLTPPTD